MIAAGLDTVALHFGSLGGSKLLSEWPGRPVKASYGYSMLPATLASGVRYIAWPGLGIVKGEGRLSALLDGDARSYRLAERGELVDAEEAMRAELRELVGRVPDGGRAEVSRYDLSVDRAYARDDGIAAIRAMKSLCPLGYVSRVYGMPDGTVNSVAYCTERRGVVAFRAYDKGVESGSDPRGERVRFEAQNKRRSGQRRSPEVVARGDLQADFARTIAPVLQAATEVKVMSPSTAVEQLGQMVARDELTPARAERIAGSIAFLHTFGRGFYDQRQSQRRLKALRDVGIAVDDEMPAGALLTIDQELRALAEGFAGV